MKKNNWDAESMQDSLITDMKQEVENGGTVELSAGTPAGEPTGAVAQPAESEAMRPALVEPTKGVQTDVPMSHYQRLYVQKMTRDQHNRAKNINVKTTIGKLALEAILLWLDVQEGKAVVQYQREGQGGAAMAQQQTEQEGGRPTVTMETDPEAGK